MEQAIFAEKMSNLIVIVGVMTHLPFPKSAKKLLLMIFCEGKVWFHVQFSVRNAVFLVKCLWEKLTKPIIESL